MPATYLGNFPFARVFLREMRNASYLYRYLAFHKKYPPLNLLIFCWREISCEMPAAYILNFLYIKFEVFLKIIKIFLTQPLNLHV